jgi:hypothetical protein
MTLCLSNLAVADLDDIYAYTFDGWGREQAERYTALLWDAMESSRAPLSVGGSATISILDAESAWLVTMPFSIEFVMGISKSPECSTA